MTVQEVDCLVIGGGAAGFFAAITAAETLAASGVVGRVVILEKAARTLGKVLVSGGGRCNVTHACFDPAQLVRFYPRGGAALRSAFSRFQPQDILDWFNQRGVRLKTEADGRIFPTTDSSHTIVDCLERAAAHSGVQVQTQAPVEKVEKIGERFHVQLRDGEIWKAATLLFATGGDGRMMSLAGTLGHRIEPPIPSLFTFTISDPRLEGLAGVSIERTGLSLDNPPKRSDLRQEGPLLITHWGLSGPVVLRLSAWGARTLHAHQYRAYLEVNWLHPLKPEDALSILNGHKVQSPRQKPAHHSPFEAIPVRLWKRLVQAAGIGEMQNWADLTKGQLSALAAELTRAQFAIQGKGPFKEEFVTCGGVALEEVSFKTMESRRLPGLYFAGEVLDVDGLTGGFNFQNAWTTGWIAGQSMAQAVLMFSQDS